MAISKVTIDALGQMANLLHQSAEDIISAKGEMDGQLRSFIWDDPTGYAFSAKYEEDFKPLMQKLIPNIENYLHYLQEQGMSISEYSGEFAFLIGGMSGALGNAARGSNNEYEGLVDARPRNKRKGLNQSFKEARNREIREKARNVLPFISTNSSGDIVWDDDRFNKLEKENAAFLSKEGKELLGKASQAFEEEKGLNLNSVKRNNLYNIVGKTIGLERAQINFERKSSQEEGLLGWHPFNSKEAILNTNEEANMSMCEKIAIYAHESGHVFQDYQIANSSNPNDEHIIKLRKEKEEALRVMKIKPRRDQFDSEERYQQSMKKWYDKYYNLEREKDARKFEIVFGKACVDYYNKTRNTNINN